MRKVVPANNERTCTGILSRSQCRNINNNINNDVAFESYRPAPLYNLLLVNRPPTNTLIWFPFINFGDIAIRVHPVNESALFCTIFVFWNHLCPFVCFHVYSVLYSAHCFHQRQLPPDGNAREDGGLQLHEQCVFAVGWLVVGSNMGVGILTIQYVLLEWLKHFGKQSCSDAVQPQGVAGRELSEKIYCTYGASNKAKLL